MTRPRSTSSPSDALGATIANQSARTASLETVAHRHAGLFGRGVVAVAQDGVGTRITGITSIVDVPSLSVQFIADPTRLYRVTASLGVLSSVAGDVVRCFLTTDTDVQLKQASTEYLLANQGTQLHLEHLMTGSGLTSLKLRVLRQVGSGTVSVLRDLPIFNNFLVVEDITGLPSPYVIAGGAALDTFITVSGTVYRVISFTGNGELQVLNGDITDVEYLVVGGGAGGGGAGANQGLSGGGGAGGLLTNLGSPIPSVSSGLYTVTVGSGGAGGGPGLNSPGADGGVSSVFGITAFGGGGGSSWSSSSNLARSGASGGGGANSTAPFTTGAAGIAGQGNNGGNAAAYAGSPNATSGGGGGGAGAVGGNGSGGNGGAGGAGLSNAITGTPTFYAGGGGGPGTVGGGAGGNGGGGAGRVAFSGNGFAGTNGLGGGGGGACDRNTGSFTGGAGGSGIIIVRFPYSPTQFQS